MVAFVRSVPIPGEPAADYNSSIYTAGAVEGGPQGPQPPVLEGVNARTTPAWSPDGSRLVVRFPSEVRILDVRNGDVQRLQWCEECSEPTWSPDGTRLIFTGRRDGRAGLWTIRSDGTDLTLLRTGEFEMARPQWSPDGRLVAVVSSTGGADAPHDQIQLLNVTGGADPTPIVPDATGYREGFGFIEGLGWAPDGRSIVFDAHMDGGGGGIFIVHLEGDEERQVFDCGEGCSDFNPTFSPDGTQIAFTRVSGIEPGSDGFTGDVMFVDAGGGEPQRLPTGEGLDCCPAWQPLPED